MIEESPTKPPPKEGEVVKGYRFNGGNPADKSSWTPDAPKPGDVRKGHEFVGGDPAKPESWKAVASFPQAPPPTTTSQGAAAGLGSSLASSPGVLSEPSGELMQPSQLGTALDAATKPTQGPPGEFRGYDAQYPGTTAAPEVPAGGETPAPRNQQPREFAYGEGGFVQRPDGTTIDARDARIERDFKEREGVYSTLNLPGASQYSPAREKAMRDAGTWSDSDELRKKQAPLIIQSDLLRRKQEQLNKDFEKYGISKLEEQVTMLSGDLTYLGDELKKMQASGNADPAAFNEMASQYNEKLGMYNQQAAILRPFIEEQQDIQKGFEYLQSKHAQSETEFAQSPTQKTKVARQEVADQRFAAAEKDVRQGNYLTGNVLDQYVVSPVTATVTKGVLNAAGALGRTLDAWVNIPNAVTGNESNYSPFAEAADNLFDAAEELAPTAKQASQPLFDKQWNLDTHALLPKAMQAATYMGMLGVAGAAAGEPGMVAASYMTTEEDYYKEAISAGLKPGEAQAFSMTSAALTSFLEKVNPGPLLNSKTVKGAMLERAAKALRDGKNWKDAVKDGTQYVIKEGLGEGGQEGLQALGDDAVKGAAKVAIGDRASGLDTNTPQAYAENVLLGLSIGTLAAIGGKAADRPLHMQSLDWAVRNRQKVEDYIKKSGRKDADQLLERLDKVSSVYAGNNLTSMPPEKSAKVASLVQQKNEAEAEVKTKPMDSALEAAVGNPAKRRVNELTSQILEEMGMTREQAAAAKVAAGAEQVPEGSKAVTGPDGKVTIEKKPETGTTKKATNEGSKTSKAASTQASEDTGTEASVPVAEQPSRIEPVLTQDVPDDQVSLAAAYERERMAHGDEGDPDQVLSALTAGDVSIDSYKQFGDQNNVAEGIAKQYLRKGGRGIDVIAQEASEITGKEVTPDDVVAFMERFPSGRPMRSPRMMELDHRHGTLHGKKLNKLSAKAILAKHKGEVPKFTPDEQVIADEAQAQGVDIAELDDQDAEAYDNMTDEEDDIMFGGGPTVAKFDQNATRGTQQQEPGGTPPAQGEVHGAEGTRAPDAEEQRLAADAKRARAERDKFVADWNERGQGLFAPEEGMAQQTIEGGFDNSQENFEAKLEPLSERVRQADKALSDYVINAADRAQSAAQQTSIPVSLGDRIRTLKIGNRGLGSFIIPPQIIDGAIEVIAKAADAGASLAEAIKRGMDHIRQQDWYRNLTAKEQVEAEAAMNAQAVKVMEFQHPVAPAPPEGERKKRRLSERIQDDPNISDEAKAAFTDNAIFYNRLPQKMSEAQADAILSQMTDAQAEAAVLDVGNGMHMATRFMMAGRLLEKYDKAEDYESFARFSDQFMPLTTEAGQGIAMLAQIAQTGGKSALMYQAQKEVMEGRNKPLSAEEIKELERLIDRVKKAPEGRPQYDAMEDLEKYKAQLKGMDWWEVPMAIWYANILSGPVTHLKNFVSNAGNSALLFANATLQKPTSAAGLARAFLHGAQRGVLEAGATWNTGYSPIRGKVEVPPTLERVDFKGGAFNPFNYLKYVRRGMVAADVLFFEAQKDMRAYQLALKDASKAVEPSMPDYDARQRAWEMMGRTDGVMDTAKKQASSEMRTEIKSGVKERTAKRNYKRRVYELVEQQRSPEIQENSHSFAARGTYNYKPEGILGMLSAWANQLGEQAPLFKLVVPFTNIIANVTNDALNYTPAGALRAGLNRQTFGKYGTTPLTAQERADLVTKAIIGTSLMTAAFAMSGSDDDEEPLMQVTANGTGDFRKNEELRKTGWQPYSIKIGDKWISYQYTPLMMGMSYIGNIRDFEKYRGEKLTDKAWTRFSVPMSWTQRTVLDQTFISSMNNFLSAVMDPRNEDRSDDLANSVAGVLRGMAVPNLYTQTAREVQEQLGVPLKEVRGDIMGRVLQDIPVARSAYEDKVNALGEPVLGNRNVFVSDVKTDPVWQLIADKQAWVGAPNKNAVSIVDPSTEKERLLTDEEFYEFSKTRGGYIKGLIEENLQELQGMPPEEVKDVITRWKGEATSAAKDALYEKLQMP